jgi:ketosteroid isomerase-like protein
MINANLFFSVPPLNGVPAFIKLNDKWQVGKHGINFTRIEKEVVIEDLRGMEDLATLDTMGFQLFYRPAKHTTFTNDEDIKREYYPENIELLKELTGASRVVVFDHSEYNQYLLRSSSSNPLQ